MIAFWNTNLLKCAGIAKSSDYKKVIQIRNTNVVLLFIVFKYKVTKLISGSYAPLWTESKQLAQHFIIYCWLFIRTELHRSGRLPQPFAFEQWDMFPIWEILQRNRCLPDGSLIQSYTEVRSAASEIKFNSQEILIVDSACSNMTFISVEGKKRRKSLYT